MGNLPVMGIYKVVVQQQATEMMWVSSVLGKECTVVGDGGSASVVLESLVEKIQAEKSPMVPVPSL
jgi:hypothetical protein